MKKKSRAGCFCILLFYLVVINFPASGAVLKVNDMSVSTGENIQVPIILTNARDIGNMDITFSFDPGVLSYISAERGNLTRNSLFDYNASSGHVKLVIVDNAGINGNGTLTIINFNVIGNPGASTGLEVIKASANNTSDFSAIPLTIQNGRLTITDAIKQTQDAKSSVPDRSDVTATPASSKVQRNNSSQISSVSFSIGDINTKKNQKIKVPVLVENANNIGAISLSIDFDPSVVNLTDIQKGDMIQSSIFYTNSSTGNIKIEIISPDGIYGNGTIAFTEFHILEGMKNETYLRLSDVVATDFETFDNIPYHTKNSTVYIENSSLINTGEKSKDISKDVKSQPGFEIFLTISGIAYAFFLMKRG